MFLRTEREIMALLDLLRSRPALASSALAHAYLKNKLLLLDERTTAEMLQEAPSIIGEMTEKLKEIQETFIEGYDPSAFVLELASFQSLDRDLRERLLAVVRYEYLGRFRPAERLVSLRRTAASFVHALHDWQERVASTGIDTESASLWRELRERALELRGLLEDQELSARWIP